MGSLFGSPFDETRYEAVLACCALKPDLAIFEDGDETEIGNDTAFRVRDCR